MLTADIITSYSNLLILQYRNLTKAKGHVEALVGPVVMDQLPTQIQSAYDINTAIGVQLDILGKYAGVTRYAYSFVQPVILSDSDFRILIKFKIMENNSGSSMNDIQNILFVFFSGSLLVFDNKDMTMSYLVDSSAINLNLLEVIIKSTLLPRPMAVGINAILFFSGITTPFGFRTYSNPAFNVSGFNSYVSYQTNWHWISYADRISV